MSLSEAQVQSALKELVDPNTGKDFITTRSAKNIKVSGDDVSLDIELGYPGKSQFDPIRKQVLARLRALPGAGNVSVGVTSKVVS
ncbi:MAG: iron-sulfur cluster assembly protein, partial [Proteobacteria bacterium]|nr:iron-sulfur cluster assembly protein [Pseudomonadota bacterium]